jgi:hypothetical protein
MERYEAQRALLHPWVTRNENTPIPLTVLEEMQYFQFEPNFLKIIRAIFFASITTKQRSPIK